MHQYGAGAHAYWCLWRPEASDPSGTGVISSREPPDVGANSQTRVLYESNIHFLPLSNLQFTSTATLTLIRIPVIESRRNPRSLVYFHKPEVGGQPHPEHESLRHAPLPMCEQKAGRPQSRDLGKQAQHPEPDLTGVQ